MMWVKDKHEGSELKAGIPIGRFMKVQEREEGAGWRWWNRDGQVRPGPESSGDTLGWCTSTLSCCVAIRHKKGMTIIYNVAENRKLNFILNAKLCLFISFFLFYFFNVVPTSLFSSIDFTRCKLTFSWWLMVIIMKKETSWVRGRGSVLAIMRSGFIPSSTHQPVWSWKSH